MEEILNAIPHRPPFLFVDRIVELTATKIRTIKEVRPEEPVFAGHYPGQPIMPGALICESIFQTGAILLSKMMGGMGEGIPVLTRINNAKFKSIVKPGTTLDVEAELVEKVSNAYFMKGKASVAGKTSVTVEFTVTLTKEAP
ncbi:MAG: 3-hydroxyacyl-ACP dehydratase FabZ [Dehalococcoidia bacterium]|nr:3-hydroxyacyl-ACP dehydratase FabZ [Dehalococcoidia bacterium]MDH4367849.1 3-hydroxyacyl-ACP dehydratase FabZ [Dehalococcoidia bacterium]